MRPGGRPEPTTGAVGVLDAGVVLTWLDRRRRAHPKVVELFDRCKRAEATLYLSVVNLAEVLQHGRHYSEAVGLDLVTLISAFGIQLHGPDATVARRVAALATLDDTSLADRFALATAETLGARLYTTEGTLAKYRARLKVPFTRF